MAICVRQIFELRSLPNPCKCVNCREAREVEEASEFYRMDLCHGEISHWDPELIFTDKEAKPK